MWLTRVMSIWKRHTNPFTGFELKSADKKWGRRKVKMMTAHVYGRERNCYKLAIRKMERDLIMKTNQRKASRRDFTDLCKLRIEAGANELNYNAFHLRESLERMHIGLNTKVLANLAIWEPRSFRSIIGLASFKTSQPENENNGLGVNSVGPGTEVIPRGHL